MNEMIDRWRDKLDTQAGCPSSFVWCPRMDSNHHASRHRPSTCRVYHSATRAKPLWVTHAILAEMLSFVNPHFGQFHDTHCTLPFPIACLHSPPVAPSQVSARQVFAGSGCWADCLPTIGRGGCNAQCLAGQR